MDRTYFTFPPRMQREYILSWLFDKIILIYEKFLSSLPNQEALSGSLVLKDVTWKPSCRRRYLAGKFFELRFKLAALPNFVSNLNLISKTNYTVTIIWPSLISIFAIVEHAALLSFHPNYARYPVYWLSQCNWVRSGRN